MSDFISALKAKQIDGCEGIRAFKGFFMNGQSDCIFEIKFNGKWMPLMSPVFKDRKELNQKVREVKKAWKGAQK